MGSNALKVAYQGVAGAYSEKAVRQLLGGHQVEVDAIGYSSFDDTFIAVQSGEADYGVLPIENSLGGSIHQNYDLLMRYELHILAELDFRVEHCLVALPGTTKDMIERVISHPQALAQCDNFLRQHKWKPCPEFDTAGSAQLIQTQNLTTTGAIASDLAAQYYKLNVLETNVEDDDTNYTRFLLLGRKPLTDCEVFPGSLSQGTNTRYEHEMKTSLVFSFGGLNQNGQLYKALSVFALRDIDLTKMESRPERGQALGDHRSKYKYLFYIDLVGHYLEPNIAHALNHLREFCPLVRVFGSFPTNGLLMGHVHARMQAAERLACSATVPTVSPRKLKIGIIGFGNFGQFLAKTFGRYHDVYATSRSDYGARAVEIGVTFVPMFDLSTFFNFELDVIVLCMSILSFEKCVQTYIVPAVNQYLSTSLNRPRLLIVDVLSVKQHPKDVLLKCFGAHEQHIDLLCTHPMFGPESGKRSWQNLPMMYEKVRISAAHALICERFLLTFEHEQCRMIEMNCELHDAHAASSQFITHLTGRVLAQLHLHSTPIDTTGFKSILNLVHTTCGDSDDLFYGLYKYNHRHALELVRQLVVALEHTQRRLSLRAFEDESPIITTTEDPTEQRVGQLVTNLSSSKTVELHALTKELESQNLHIVSLCVGESDVDPHAVVYEATKEAVDTGRVKYTAVAGAEPLRRAIVNYLHNEKHVTYDHESQVIVTNGAKQAVYEALVVLCSRGDEVIVPAPYWVSYPEMIQLAQARPVILTTCADSGFCITPRALRRHLSRHTRAIIVCNPSNPTGKIHTRMELEALAQVLREPEYCHICVVADEIYERLDYAQQHVCFATLEGMYHRTLVINGFSKGYAMTGYRVGYCVGPVNLIRAMTRLQSHITSCASSISQHAALAALTKCSPAEAQDYHDSMVQQMQVKRDYALAQCRGMPELDVIATDGAFYLFPSIARVLGKRSPGGTVIHDSSDFCLYLLEHFHTAFVPGTAFGQADGLRIVYATSMDTLVKAMDNLKRALASLV